jgi:hypothetical protein
MIQLFVLPTYMYMCHFGLVFLSEGFVLFWDGMRNKDLLCTNLALSVFTSVGRSRSTTYMMIYTV